MDSFRFESKGCAKMNELEVEIEQLRQLVVALVETEEVGCTIGSGGGQWMIKWGKVMRKMLGKAHVNLEGG